MRLTVLGNPDRYLAPLADGTSYLLEHGDARVLLDAGPGARAALAQRGIERLDAVWISHFHFDHVLDLVTLRGPIDDRTRILVPRGERARLDALARAYAFEGAFDLGADVEEAADAPVRVGGIDLRFAPTQHSVPSMAMRADADGHSLVYASDTAPCASLAALARGADLLLMHTLLPTVEPESHHARVHSTAQTAARLAAEAGARRLILSHRYHESPDAAMLEAARGVVPVTLAARGQTFFF